MPSGSQNQILPQLVQSLHLVAITTISIKHHLAENYAGVDQQSARSRSTAIPKHIARGDLDSNPIFRQFQRLGLDDYLIEQDDCFGLQLELLFLLLLSVRCWLSGR